jgi:menaquinone-9 beta-reductase
MAHGSDHDVAIIGAGLAGSAAAAFLGRAGLRVALIERKPDPGAYKRVCGHFIQPSGVPVLDRLGVLDPLEAAGAARGRGRVWTRAGWFGDNGRETLPEALNIRRAVLDPLLRATARETPGVDLLAGATLEGLAREDGHHRLALRGHGELRARLVVGADGRGSRTAQLAGLRERRSPNVRFGYWGYFEGPQPPTGVAVQLWLREPDVAIVTPTDSGLVMYVAMPHRSRLDGFRADPERALRAFFAELPDAPPIAQSRLVGRMVGKLDLTNESRPPAGDGIALIGDAALAADPAAAIGCGWALQSAEWLAHAVAPALAGAEPLPRALRRYARRHRHELRGHAFMLAEFARRETLSPVQRLLFGAAVHDDAISERLGAFAGRLIRPSELLTPRTLAHAAAVGLRARRVPPAFSRTRAA